MKTLGLLLCATLATRTPGQAFFDAIVGKWAGHGELFGQPTEFEMSWTVVLGGRFARIDYSILGPRPMEAVGHYRLGGETSTGVWVDTRGEILDLEGSVFGERLETVWRSPTEVGRTVYRLLPDGTLEVSDFYHDGSGWQPFGSATYTRVP